MTADITLRGPGDVLAVLPYQLGYHPRSCVVAVSLRGRSVGMVARTDLPPDEHVDSVVSALVGPLQRDGATSVILLGYEDVPEASQPALLSLVGHLEAAQVEVVDVVVVRDGRRYSPVCSEPCCPPDGIPLPDPADVPAVAEFVARGRAPLPSRDAVEALVAADPDLCRGVADAVAVRWRMPRRRRRCAVAWRLVLRHESEWSFGPSGGLGRPDRTGPRPGWRPQVVADAAIGLADIAWRDGLVAWLAPGVLPMSAVDHHVVALLHSTLPAWGGMGSQKGWLGVSADASPPSVSGRGRPGAAPDRPANAGVGERSPGSAADDVFDAIVGHGFGGMADEGFGGMADDGSGGMADQGSARMAGDGAAGRVGKDAGGAVADGLGGTVESGAGGTVDGTVEGGTLEGGEGGTVEGGVGSTVGSGFVSTGPGVARGGASKATAPGDDVPDAGERRVLLQRLLELCRAVPDECDAEAAAVCTVAAHLAWVEGDGALARAAVDRALRLAPEYRLAQLLLRLIDAGLRLPRREPGDGPEALGRAG